LYGAKVTICSEINTKHLTTVWQNVKFLNAKPVGASCDQYTLKFKINLGNRSKRMRGTGYWLRIMSLGGLIWTLHHVLL